MANPFPLDIQPGVVRSLSSNALKARWYDCNHIRFRAGRAQKIGGCTKLFADQLDGAPRGMRGWTTVAGVDMAATGTYRRAYSCSDTPDDITPLADSGTLGNDPFATTNASAVVVVTDAAHGLDNGSIAVFDGAAAVAGITIDGEYEVTVIDSGSYSITHSAPANATTSGGGAAVTYEYLLNPGNSAGAIGLGWGVGPYGMEEWGAPRSATEAVELELRSWSFATRNGILYLSPAGGGIYTWDEPNNDARAEILAGAPTECRYMFITAEGIVVALGTDAGPMVMEWSDRDDVNDWTPANDNTANERRLLVGNKLVAGTQFGEINLVWSDTALYTMQYIDGTTVIYDTRPVGRGCGLAGHSCYAVIDRIAFWVSAADFHIFAGGSVESAPRFDEIRNFIFEHDSPYKMDMAKADRMAVGYNHKFNEFWVHYVSVSSADGEPDRYVKVCTDDWSWDFGSWRRSAMTYLESADGDVIMADPEGFVFIHEDGHDDDGEILEAYVESSIWTLGEGNVDMEVLLLVPDFQIQSGDVSIELTAYKRPQSTTEEDNQEIVCEEGSEEEDARFAGRHVKVRVSSAVLDGDFRLGTPNFYIQEAGRR